MAESDSIAYWVIVGQAGPPPFFWTAMSLAAARARLFSMDLLNVPLVLDGEWLKLRHCPIITAPLTNTSTVRVGWGTCATRSSSSGSLVLVSGQPPVRPFTCRDHPILTDFLKVVSWQKSETGEHEEHWFSLLRSLVASAHS